jgi:hypothetical protein
LSYSTLISERNLRLAWNRILTSTGMQYKQMFRPVYYAFQSGVADNIRRLHERLEGGWQPSVPDRVYLPKPSGLQRPITVLGIEDQIVLQAVANQFERVLRPRRQHVENRLVFSNVLNAQRDSIFFVEDWHQTYFGFQQQCIRHYAAGLRWVAHFDIAAFYDTISHELLIRRVSPRGGDRETWARVRGWLQRWSSPDQSEGFHHGIPQGPIASDFLAECFLLAVDEAIEEAGIAYVRYVDDIRLFAMSENGVREAAIRLEKACRSVGLLPQGEKFAVHEATRSAHVLGALPSLPPDDRDDGEWAHSADETTSMFRATLEGRPLRVTDKSTFRYVLYRAPPIRKILKWCTELLPRHPEHIDAFTAYFGRFDRSVPLRRALEAYLVSGVPYEYVRGHLWRYLKRFGDDTTISRLRPVAVDELGSAAGLVHRAGIFEFLLEAEKRGNGRIAGRVRHEHPIVQAWLVRWLPERAWEPGGVVRHLLLSRDMLPGLLCIDGLVKRHLSHSSFGIRVRHLTPEVQNAFRGVGLIFRRNAPRVDQVGDLLEARFAIAAPSVWREVLGGEYAHGLQLLLRAESVYREGPSDWLMHQNSFNEILFRAFVRFMQARGQLQGVHFADPNTNRRNTYGWLLDPNRVFSQAFPAIGGPLYRANHRRNRLPNAHAYGNRGGQNRFLSRGERDSLRGALSGALSCLAHEVDVVR